MAWTGMSNIEAALEDQQIGPLQLRVAAICLLAQTFDGFDLSSISMAAPALAQAWHLPGTAFANTFVMSSVGIMVGALASGPTGDRIGRKPVLIASLLLLLVSSLACAEATTIPMLAALRFVTGLGVGTLMPATVALTSDYLPNRLRATIIMFVFTGAPLGGFLGGQLVAWLLPVYGWTVIFLIGGLLPAMLLPIAALWLPESPRFLLRRAHLSPRTRRLLQQLNIEAPEQGRLGTTTVDVATGNPVAGLFRDGLAQTTVLVWILYFANLCQHVSDWLLDANGSAHVRTVAGRLGVRRQPARRRPPGEYFPAGPAQPAFLIPDRAGRQSRHRHRRDRSSRTGGPALCPASRNDLPDRVLHHRQHDGHQRHDRRPVPSPCPQHRHGLGARCRTARRYRRSVVRRNAAEPGLAASPGLPVRLRNRLYCRPVRRTAASANSPAKPPADPHTSLKPRYAAAWDARVPRFGYCIVAAR